MTLSRFIFRTKLAFLNTCGGLNVLGSTDRDSSDCEAFGSAEAKLDRAARQLEKKAIDLILGST